MTSTRNTDSKFWGICIPVRIALAVLVWFLPEAWLPAAGAVALLGVAWLLYRFVTYDSQQLGVFKQHVTWNNLRPIHVAIWGLFSFLALTKNPHAKFIPFADVFLGAVGRSLLVR